MKRKLTAGVFAVIMAASLMMGGVQVKAEGDSTTIENKPTTAFAKYLVMDKEANVPNVSFTYTITEGAAKTYTDGSEVLAGVDADKVTMAGVDTTTANTIAYTTADVETTGGNLAENAYDANSQKYVEKQATLNFSKCRFTEPGIYRYILTESGTNLGVTNDQNAKRALDVYVYNDPSNDGFIIGSYVLHSNADVAPKADSDSKSNGFVNVYETSNLTFKKQVAGNQASHSKYFKFTVTISGATEGTVYDVDVTKADSSVDDNENVTKLTVGQGGTVTQDFYLKHDQEITIKGIAKGSTYNVTEDADGYQSEAAVVTGYIDPVQGSIASKDVNTSYRNTRDGVLPTGVAMTVAPFAAAVVLGGAGVVTFAGRKKREDEE